MNPALNTLTATDEEFLEKLFELKSNRDTAAYFNCSIWAVHDRRTALRKEGVKIPRRFPAAPKRDVSALNTLVRKLTATH